MGEIAQTNMAKNFVLKILRYYMSGPWLPCGEAIPEEQKFLELASLSAFVRVIP